MKKYQGVGFRHGNAELPVVEARGFTPHAFETRITTIRPSPSIVISRNAYDAMRYIVRLCPKEVGWLGCVTERPGSEFHIEEVILYKQEVSDIETHLHESDLSIFGSEQLMENPKGEEVLATLRFWGHSHVRMPVLPSRQDDETMDMIGRTKVDWWIRGIFNKFGVGRFCFYDFARGIVVHDVPWSREEEERPKVAAQIRQSLAEKVREPRVFFGTKSLQVPPHENGDFIHA